MKVALIEYKVRIMPPEDASNEVMDAALELVLGNGKHVSMSLSGKQHIQQELTYYLAIAGLKAQGFTVEVEEINE